jgi:subtilisin-like proprotein convertase family protein
MLISLMLFAAAAWMWQVGDRVSAARHRSATPPAALTVKTPAVAAAVVANGSKGGSMAGGGAAAAHRPSYRLSNTAQTAAQLGRNERGIILRNALIDTARGVKLEVPEHLRAQGAPGAYIVQSRRALDAGFYAELRKAGAVFVSYIPNNAALVQATPEAAQGMAADGRFATVMPYEPYYKLDSSLLAAAVEQTLLTNNELRVTTFPGQREAALQSLTALGANVMGEEQTPFGTTLIVTVPPDQLAAVARMPQTQEIETFSRRHTLNDLTRVQLGVTTDPMPATTNYLNLDGSNVWVVVNDTGVDVTHPDFGTNRLFGDNPVSLSDTNGHGTHVAGIIAGSGSASTNVTNVIPGSASGADFRGMAPAASLYSQQVDLTTGPFVSDSYLQTNASRTLGAVSRTNGAMLTNGFICNNSWGYSSTSYDTAAASYDAAVRNSQPNAAGEQMMTFVFAAGDLGGGSGSGFDGTEGTISSPGTAKNVITVGAIDHARYIDAPVDFPEFSESNITVFWSTTDNSNLVAGFSSCGNVDIGIEGVNGRFKPDVVAPGIFIVSARSTNYIDPTNVSTSTEKNFPAQTVQPGRTNIYPIRINSDTTNLIIQLAPNALSPAPFPTDLQIWFDTNYPPRAAMIVTLTNDAGVPEVTNLAVWESTNAFFNGYIAIYSPKTEPHPVAYDLNTYVIETNGYGTYFTVLSNLNTNLMPSYRYESGTSMSAAAVSGLLADMEEFLITNFKTNLNGSTPSPALLKALLINGARPLGNGYDFDTQPQGPNAQGWGLPSLPNSIPANLLSNGPASLVFFEQSPTNALQTGEWSTYTVNLSDLSATNSPLRVTLVWTDPPGNPAAGVALVNDLDLIVADSASNIYVGNDFPAGYIFSVPSNPTNLDLPDVINNVENVYIDTSFTPLSPPYYVCVRGKRVNVNAATTQSNWIGQDYALVISSDDQTMASALQVTGPVITTNAPPPQLAVYTNYLVNNTSNTTPTPTFSHPTNAVPMLDQRVGANDPNLYRAGVFGGTNGNELQWHFFVFTDGATQRKTNSAFTNVLFATFLSRTLTYPNSTPPNLSVPANNDADIDLYVSTDSNLLVLDANAMANASKSLGRGGDEVVIFTNTSLGSVTYYAGVKSESQQGSDFDFLAVVTTNLSTENSDGSITAWGLPLPSLIPDTGVTGVDVLAYIGQGITVRKVAVSVGASHSNPADLYGTINYYGQPVVLDHYSSLAGNPAGFTNFYDDLPEGWTPGAVPSEGPGSLQDYVGLGGSGLWRLNAIDKALTQVGEMDVMSVTVWPQPPNQTNFIAIKPAKGWYYGFVDVPNDATNMNIQVTNSNGALQEGIYITNQQPVTLGDYHADPITNGGSLNLNVTNNPPLTGGRWYFGITNELSAVVTNHVLITFKESGTPNLTLLTANNTATPLLTDGHTVSQICINGGLLSSNQQLLSLEVGVRLTDTNLDDLVLHLTSPQGTSVLLFEERGGTNATDLGSGNAASGYTYTTFTENTNLAPQLMKFLPPPFAQPVSTATFINTGFEGVSEGDYGPTNTIFPTTLGTNLAGWMVVSNNVSVVGSNDLYRGNTGTNFLALANGEMTNQITTFVGEPYAMRFAYRGPGLVDWWPLEGNADDLIGTNNGVISGSLTNVYGVVGQALQFNGKNGQIDFGPTAGNVGSNDFTIDYWMNTTSTRPEAFLAKRAVCAVGSSLDIMVGYPFNGTSVLGVLAFGLRDDFIAGGVGSCACFTSSALNDGQWHHVAWVRRANPGRSTANVLVYVDGQFNNSSNNQPITYVTNSTHLILGSNVCVGVNGEWAYSGAADELGIWNRALSDAEIAALYEAGLNGVGKATTTSILPNCQILVNGVTNATLIAPASSANWLTNTVYFTALSNNTTVAIRGNPMGMLFDDFVLTGPANLNFVQPEESLAPLTNQNPLGCWTLDVWDTRNDSIVPTNGVLLSWNMQMTISSTNVNLIVLTNHIPYTNGMVAGNGGIAYFAFDVPFDASFATNTLTTPTNNGSTNLSLLFNQIALPTGTGLGDWTLITNANTNNSIYVLTNNAPPPCLLPGWRYFLGVQNTNATPTNFTIVVDTDELFTGSVIALTNAIPYTNLILVTSNAVPFTTNRYATNAPQYYSFVVPANAILASFEIINPTNEIDLYIRHTLPLPGSTSYDYATSYAGTNDESIVVSTNSFAITNGVVDTNTPLTTNSMPVPLTPGTWYLAVYDNSPTNTTNLITYRIVATYLTNAVISGVTNSAITVIPLTNAVFYTNTAAPGPALTNFYSFSITNSTRSVRFLVTNMTGNVDLIARLGDLPTPEDMTDGSFNPGNQPEVVTIVTNASLPSLNGIWYLGVPNNATSSVTYWISATTNVPGTYTFPAVTFSGMSATTLASGFTMNWYATAGAQYEIDLTTNLTTWIAVTNITSSNGAGTYTDPTPIGTQTARFYRVIRTQ